jgi:hypothetical protein
MMRFPPLPSHGAPDGERALVVESAFASTGFALLAVPLIG